MKSEYRRKQEAKERESKALQQIKKRLGVRAPKPLRGAMQSPLVAKAWERRPRTAPTSDQIPASAPADDFMHAHKWKRGVRENVATVKEIRRKASKIAPAQRRSAISARRKLAALVAARIKSVPISACPFWVKSGRRSDHTRPIYPQEQIIPVLTHRLPNAYYSNPVCGSTPVFVRDSGRAVNRRTC